MKTLKYEIKNERISIQEEINQEEMKKFPYVLIFDKNNIEYTICKYDLYYEENLEIIWFIDLESDYDFFTDELLNFEIEIIGFLETIPFNYEHEQEIIDRYEMEKEIIKKEYIRRSLLHEKD